MTPHLLDSKPWAMTPHLLDSLASARGHRRLLTGRNPAHVLLYATLAAAPARRPGRYSRKVIAQGCCYCRGGWPVLGRRRSVHVRHGGGGGAPRRGVVPSSGRG